MEQISEYRFGNAIVRIHGNAPKREVLEQACIRFVKAVEADKREAQSKAS